MRTPLILLLAVLALASVAADALPGAVVVPGAPDGAGLRIAPAVVTVAGGDVVTHRVTNGTDRTLALTLRVSEVEVDPDAGPTLVGAGDAAPLPAAAAELAAGETLHLTWQVPDGRTPVLALVAGTADGSEATAFVARGAPRSLRSDVTWHDDAAAVTLHADTDAAAVDARLRMTTWYGATSAELTATDLVLGPAGRRLTIDAGEGWLPGPRTLELVAGRDGTVVHTRSWGRVVWPDRFVIALAALLLVATAATLRHVHRRRGRPPVGRTPTDL